VPRSPIFNATVCGRMVATIGEIALVLQPSECIHDAKVRLGMFTVSLLSSRFCGRGSELAVMVFAETLSWSGVLTGIISKFCCGEYVVLWMLIAIS
jgi:hypothetical protein